MDNKELKYIAIDQIIPNRNQPRTHFEKESIVELAQSIKQNGIIQPLVVRKNKNNQYEIVAGERRFRAAVISGYSEIPCIVENYDDLQSAEIAIIENVQRENLTAIEEALAYERLMEMFGYTQQQMAAKVGKKQSTIANKLRLLMLPQNIQEKIRNREITERHARALLSLRDEKKMNQVVEEITSKNLTVKDTELLIEAKSRSKKNQKKNKGITQNIKIAVNTINQALEMVKRSGNVVKTEYQDQEDEYVITIKIKKHTN